MGIPKFFNYIKNNVAGDSDCIIEFKNRFYGNKKWDFLILDYQSLLYSSYNIFSYLYIPFF